MTSPLPIEAMDASLVELSLRTTFRTHWKSIRTHRTLIVRLRAGGILGEGEAYTLEPEEALRDAERLEIVGRDAWILDPLLESISNVAVRSAVDLALHDLLGKAIGIPVCALLGLPRVSRQSCVSVGIDEPGRMIAAAGKWIEAGYPILKVKLTTETDLRILEEIRKTGGDSLRIWVDANQAFDADQAIETAAILSRIGVELFEQPLSVGRMADYRRIAPAIPLPIILDEEVRSASDVARAATAGGIEGVNIKLAKLGGIRESLRAIQVARAHRMRVFIGCYFESSLGISGSTHLLAFADYVDLDAPLFLEHDPYQGLAFEGERLGPPKSPGLGVRRRSDSGP
jgi:L-alanine-DL-glutamate epimerase-like enolase superfamily enzyme